MTPQEEYITRSLLNLPEDMRRKVMTLMETINNRDYSMAMQTDLGPEMMELIITTTALLHVKHGHPTPFDSSFTCAVLKALSVVHAVNNGVLIPPEPLPTPRVDWLVGNREAVTFELDVAKLLEQKVQ